MVKEKYDLVCSLGGNCAAAHNLLYRNLRMAAFPFDWTYFNSDEAIYQLVSGFRDNFKNYALKSNFKELPINYEHVDRIQYEDGYGKIVWANHFNYNEDREKNYKEVKQKLDRRFHRLVNFVKKSKKILFLFSVSFEIKPDSFLYLVSSLNKIYHDKYFKIKVLSFNAKKDFEYKNQNLEIQYYHRKMNIDDFTRTNKEWNFLDDVRINRIFLYKLQKAITKLLISLVPVKAVRHKLKREYHV